MEAQKLTDLIDESNGKKTIWEQFAELRTSISNVRKSIHNLFVRMTVAEATDMDHQQKLDSIQVEIKDVRAENKRLVEENSQIKHNVTALTERLMRLEKEMKNARNARNAR